MSRSAIVLVAAVLIAPAVYSQSFSLRVSPQVTLGNGEKMVAPMELLNTGTTPLSFGASTQNEKWGLSGVVVVPGQPIGLALSTFQVSSTASKTIPPGLMFHTGPSFGLYLPGNKIVHVNCNPPSNASVYMRVPVSFGSAASASAPTIALPGSSLAPATGQPGNICWGVSWVPSLKYGNLIGHSVGARGACVVLAGDLRSGRVVAVNVFGRVGYKYFLYWSLKTGSTPSPWGTIRLDVISMLPFPSGGIPSAGANRSWYTVPSPSLPKFTLYMQALVYDPNGTAAELSNLAEITSS